MKVDLKKLKSIAKVELTIEPEDRTYVGEFDDPVCVEWIRDQLARGNEWAWCTVKVSVTHKGHTCSDYLGGCSYESRKSFVEGGGYYDDMVLTALKELAGELETIANDHDIREHDPIYCFWCIAAEFPQEAPS